MEFEFCKKEWNAISKSRKLRKNQKPLKYRCSIVEKNTKINQYAMPNLFSLLPVAVSLPKTVCEKKKQAFSQKQINNDDIMQWKRCLKKHKTKKHKTIKKQ